ncbi:DUF1523 family protein [Rhodobacter sp. Har01]|uniref:DUF1523 family protein n=1 Tax=Rhodobacter sp. Har01 TaxID=2883999 RepID=UPI001D093A00|nr:DUF1523 family protein [Rhodobacter sp. Har01]MCB6179508.1 DUF1523 family protein [Rhodobacter sp. Har01]
MWTKVKWGFRIVLVLILGAFLHYTLPQHDVVQIINTYNKVTPIGANWIFYSSGDTGTGTETETAQRDIRFIDAVYPDGSTVMVYRNEDTGWIWPPYFKWDSSTLQAEATNLKTEKATPQWVSITHYGWRLEWLSVFPNAVKIAPVAGPDVSIIPWVNIVILTFLAFVVFMIRRMWLQFRERAVDPTFDRIDAGADAAMDEVKGVWGRFSGWLGSWRSKRK